MLKAHRARAQRRAQRQRTNHHDECGLAEPTNLNQYAGHAQRQCAGGERHLQTSVMSSPDAHPNCGGGGQQHCSGQRRETCPGRAMQSHGDRRHDQQRTKRQTGRDKCLPPAQTCAHQARSGQARLLEDPGRRPR